MKKKFNLMVRISEEQKEKVKSFCDENGMGQSEFIRELIEKRDLNSIKIFTPEERKNFEEMNLSLKKIGTNINQIAHFLNLEHLKGMGNFKSIEDLFVIDKLTEKKIDGIIDNINLLKKALIILNRKIEKEYVSKK